MLGWRREANLNSKHKIQGINERLKTENTRPLFNRGKVTQLEWELKEVWDEEERYWQTKSRTQWLKLGDKNTAYFHAKTIQRRQQNRIVGLEDKHGVWQDNEEAIEGIVIDYFSDIFSSQKPAEWDNIIDKVRCKVTQRMNALLTREFSAAEIQSAAFQIGPNKAPGPDGMSAKFFQSYWHIVGHDIIKAVQSFFHLGKLLKSINFTNVVLIPKVKCPMNMSQLRPISLCNVSYKIIAKVLASRLRLVLPDVISENQSAFVLGRQITDNILMAHEVMHSLKGRRAGKNYSMAIKLDMSKAYDRVEWGFFGDHNA